MDKLPERPCRESNHKAVIAKVNEIVAWINHEEENKKEARRILNGK